MCLVWKSDTEYTAGMAADAYLHAVATGMHVGPVYLT